MNTRAEALAFMKEQGPNVTRALNLITGKELTPICGKRGDAPGMEFYGDVRVQASHVCSNPVGHEGPCRCHCGARFSGE